MYAVIATGGKQYRVQPGIIVEVEKLEGDVGAPVTFDQILMVSKPGETSQIWLGKPLLNGAKVQAEIVAQGRGDKVTIIKMKRRKGYRKTQGHRQCQTQLIITGLDNGSGEKLDLSDADKKKTLASFYTDLAPKGLPSTPKTLGSRKRLAAEKTTAAKATGSTEAAPKVTATAKKAASATTEAAPAKKAPAKKAAPKKTPTA